MPEVVDRDCRGRISEARRKPARIRFRGVPRGAPAPRPFASGRIVTIPAHSLDVREPFTQSLQRCTGLSMRGGSGISSAAPVVNDFGSNPSVRFDHSEPAMSHKFSVGQTVLFTPGDFEVLSVAATGTITRLLPKEGMDYQYHVQVAADGTERRARENQLRIVSAVKR
jgi:hypothetical protein